MDPEQEALLADSVGLALLVVLNREPSRFSSCPVAPFGIDCWIGSAVLGQ
jgi:hypothetical protein